MTNVVLLDPRLPNVGRVNVEDPPPKLPTAVFVNVEVIDPRLPNGALVKVEESLPIEVKLIISLPP